MNFRLRSLLSIFTLLAMLAPLEAEPAGRKGFTLEPIGGEVAIRAGYGMPFGQFEKSDSTSYLLDFFNSTVPVQLDAGVRFGDLYLGAYGQLTPLVQFQPGCEGTLRCDGGVTRVGGVIGLQFSSGHDTIGWVHLGAGYEWFSLSFTQGGDNESLVFSGMEWANLQFGFDQRLTPGLFVGLFAAGSLGQFERVSARDASRPAQEPLVAPIQDREFHAWATFGVRGKFDVGELVRGVAKD